MPRIARHAPQDLIYHALNRAVARLPLFQKDADYEAFERVVEEAHEKFPIQILAWDGNVFLCLQVTPRQDTPATFIKLLIKNR